MDEVIYQAFSLSLQFSPRYVEGMIEALKNGGKVRYIVGGGDTLAELVKGKEGLVNALSYYTIIDLYDRVRESNDPITPDLQAKLGHDEIHAKTLSIDGKMLIVGSSNFGPGAWHRGPLYYSAINLSEYNIAIDDPQVTQQYNTYFNDMWDNGDWPNLVVVKPDGPNAIQNAVNLAQSHDILVLAPGIYQESVLIDKPLKLYGSRLGGVVIFPPIGQPGIRVTSSDVEISYLIVVGGTEYAIELIDSSPNSLENVVIRKVIFEDNDLGGVLIEGLIPGSPVNYILENNTFINGQQGVKINILEEQAETAIIRNNLFWGQSTIPIKIDSTTDGGVDYGYNLFNNCARAVGGAYSGPFCQNTH
jgi:hypothetical protein